MRKNHLWTAAALFGGALAIAGQLPAADKGMMKDETTMEKGMKDKAAMGKDTMKDAKGVMKDTKPMAKDKMDAMKKDSMKADKSGMAASEKVKMEDKMKTEQKK